MSFLPIGFLIIFCIFWIIYDKLGRKKINLNFHETINLSFSIFVFSCQPGIINSLFKILTCQEINGKFYLKTDFSQECYSSRHNFWIYNVCIPSFLIYAVLLPAIALTYMIMNKNKLHEIQKIRKIGFLTFGYAINKYQW
jgi:hypothetical protein